MPKHMALSHDGASPGTWSLLLGSDGMGLLLLREPRNAVSMMPKICIWWGDNPRRHALRRLQALLTADGKRLRVPALALPFAHRWFPQRARIAACGCW